MGKDKKPELSCVCCNASGKMCCFDFPWLANQVVDYVMSGGYLDIVMYHDADGKDRLAFQEAGGSTVTMSYCPFCGTRLGNT